MSNVTNKNKKLWRTVGLTSFQKPLLQCVLFFFNFVHLCLLRESKSYLLSTLTLKVTTTQIVESSVTLISTMALNCYSIVNKFIVCMNSVLIFWWTDHEQMWPRYELMKLVKIKDKSINETSVSSISTDWSIQSISIKSDLPIFIDLIYRLTTSGRGMLLRLSKPVKLVVRARSWDQWELS